MSLALQHGVPLALLCNSFAHTRFEPSGWTGSDEIGYAKSFPDYVARWLQLRFIGVPGSESLVLLPFSGEAMTDRSIEKVNDSEVSP
jgi:ribonucleoside-diphosphate reductase alpha chain